MHQAPATIWNQIAEMQPLATPWAEQMFPLSDQEMETALAREEERLTPMAGSAKVAAAYLMVAPLVWESEAIRAFSEEAGPIPSLPLIETAQDAVIVASADFPLTKAEQRTLHDMLSTPPT
jgi:hypothetical protein